MAIWDRFLPVSSAKNEPNFQVMSIRATYLRQDEHSAVIYSFKMDPIGATKFRKIWELSAHKIQASVGVARVEIPKKLARTLLPFFVRHKQNLFRPYKVLQTTRRFQLQNPCQFFAMSCGHASAQYYLHVAYEISSEYHKNEQTTYFVYLLKI